MLISFIEIEIIIYTKYKIIYIKSSIIKLAGSKTLNRNLVTVKSIVKNRSDLTVFVLKILPNILLTKMYEIGPKLHHLFRKFLLT